MITNAVLVIYNFYTNVWHSVLSMSWVILSDIKYMQECIPVGCILTAAVATTRCHH